eukprot:6303954-Amphidinium_carterae.1
MKNVHVGVCVCVINYANPSNDCGDKPSKVHAMEASAVQEGNTGARWKVQANSKTKRDMIQHTQHGRAECT